ncbi:MAG: methyltransferase domain-containing protein, partial [Candidatus Pacebacteria bacterium]|nr:methyltransferase domain-containing protein [Candidatus Paceibacterota bacterium]
MKYIFHLGRIPALSIAELQAILRKTKIKYSVKFISKKMLTLDIENKIIFKELLVQMGGIIKIAEFLGSYQSAKDAFEKINSIIEKMPGKKTVGYSFYPQEKTGDNAAYYKNFKEITENFINIKKSLAEKSGMRLIFPDNKKMELNSASIFKNKLTIKGIEFNIMMLNNKIILSKTIATQDVESYSKRDYGRPNRDSHTGMIPPKLAQIMINFASVKEGQVILDPFCGIGTIMQEALLNDYMIIGSDANDKQIENCKINLEWLSKKYILKYPNYKIFQSDISSISKKIKQNSIDAIVTESTLGPVYTKVPQKMDIKKNFKNLEKTHLRFFQIAKLVLRKGARIVVTLPAYKIKQNQYAFTPFVDKLKKMGYSAICPLDKKFITKSTKVTSRNSITYDRPDQIVAR